MAVKIRKGGEWVEVSSAGGGATVTTSDSAPTSPSDGDLWWNSLTGILNVYYEDANSSQWVNATGRGGGVTAGITKVAVLEDQKTSGTAGGNFDSGAWRDRTLNTESDPQSFVTLDSGNVYFSLPAGTYEIKWSAPATAVDNHQTRLIYATDTGFSSGVNYVYGSSEQSDQNEGAGGASTIINDTRSFGTIVITTGATNYFKIQHRCATSSVGSGGNTQDWGMGKPAGFSGDSQLEVYTQVSIQDLATAVKESNISNNIWNVVKTGTQTITGTSWTEVSDLTQTVTSPTADTKFLITVVCNAATDDQHPSLEHDSLARLVRTTSGVDTVIGSGSGDTEGFGQTGGQISYYEIQSMNLTYLDTPGVGTHTYHVMGRASSSSYNMLINTRGAGGYSTYSQMTIQQYS